MNVQYVIQVDSECEQTMKLSFNLVHLAAFLNGPATACNLQAQHA